MTTARPRTIQIYLPSGDPRGLRVAQLTTGIVQVIEVPRALMSEFQTMPQAVQVGVYLLIGDEEDAERQSVYIGQTGGLAKRLNDHHVDPKKEFWSRALVMVTENQTLTQTHALYLEWQGILQANSAARYRVENGNAGSKPHTPPPLQADCEEFFETLRTLVATLGQPIFEPLSLGKDKAPPDDVFYLKGPTYNAVAEYTEEGMVVLKGSKARVDVVPSMMGLAPEKRRLALLADGALVNKGAHLEFVENTLFKSPSGASDAVSGSSTNGWQVWKSKFGKTLGELKRNS